jgi:hypothetical protein
MNRRSRWVRVDESLKPEGPDFPFSFAEGTLSSRSQERENGFMTLSVSESCVKSLTTDPNWRPSAPVSSTS